VSADAPKDLISALVKLAGSRIAFDAMVDIRSDVFSFFAT
jgi:hypothetical protein